MVRFCLEGPVYGDEQYTHSTRNCAFIYCCHYHLVAVPTQEVACSPRYLPRLFSLTELKKHKRSRHRRAAPPITINLVELNSYRNGHQLDFDVLCSQRILPFALSIKNDTELLSKLLV